MPRAFIPSRRLICALLVILALPLLAQSGAGEPAKDDPSISNAEKLGHAANSLLLDAVQTNAGYFVVGERGHILSSTDGKTWTQVEVPTRSALTSIATADGQLWAAGHDGVILHSADNGQSWSRRRVSVWQPGSDDITLGVPVLDLMFTDASNGIAIGAYSLMLVTSDGGATWTQKRIGSAPVSTAKPAATDREGEWTFSADQLQLEEESDPHFNAIARTGSGAMVIVGERGTVYRSRDNGGTWQKVRLPYQGSMFGVLAWEGEHILAYGLRGNAYESMDLGDSWTKVDTGSASSLMGGTALPNGGAVLVGGNGRFLMRNGSNDTLIASTYLNAAGESPLLSGVLPDGSGGFVVISDKGVGQYSPK